VAEVQLPQLGESVTEGIITAWLVSPGDTVAVDQPIVEVSTDKVDTEIPSPVAGTVAELRAEVDETVQVGQVIAVITADDNAAAPAAAPTDAAPAAAAAAPALHRHRPRHPHLHQPRTGTGTCRRPGRPKPTSRARLQPGDVTARPKDARDAGVPASAVSASGPGGASAGPTRARAVAGRGGARSGQRRLRRCSREGRAADADPPRDRRLDDALAADHGAAHRSRRGGRHLDHAPARARTRTPSARRTASGSPRSR
jgi:pyruvate dehydrogenase E2 component (dihydrolipoamide acetyltransferase)